MIPIGMPMPTAISVDSSASSSDSRVAAMVRAKMSCPIWSVPNRCAPDGPFSASGTLIAAAWLPHTRGPMMARTTMATMTTAAAIPVGVASARRSLPPFISSPARVDRGSSALSNRSTRRLSTSTAAPRTSRIPWMTG